jgi:hypothetical protein
MFNSGEIATNEKGKDTPTIWDPRQMTYLSMGPDCYIGVEKRWRSQDAHERDNPCEIPARFLIQMY